MITIGMRLYANGINLKHLNSAHRAVRLCFLLSGKQMKVTYNLDFNLAKW